MSSTAGYIDAASLPEFRAVVVLAQCLPCLAGTISRSSRGDAHVTRLNTAQHCWFLTAPSSGTLLQLLLASKVCKVVFYSVSALPQVAPLKGALSKSMITCKNQRFRLAANCALTDQVEPPVINEGAVESSLDTAESSHRRRSGLSFSFAAPVIHGPKAILSPLKPMCGDSGLSEQVGRRPSRPAP